MANENVRRAGTVVVALLGIFAVKYLLRSVRYAVDLGEDEDVILLSFYLFIFVGVLLCCGWWWARSR